MKYLLVSIFLLSTFYFLFSPTAAFAQEASLIDELRGRTYDAPIETLSRGEEAVIDIVNWAIRLFWILAVGFVIWSAFLYLTAGGNEEKITEAKKRLLYALIAAAIALLATGIGPITENLLLGRGGGSYGGGYGDPTARCRLLTDRTSCESAGCRWSRGLFSYYCFSF